MTAMRKDNNDPGYEIPKDMYVKLISSDGHEFYIKRDLALISQTIKAMLSGPGLLFYYS
jgi:transcription elongation factor B subunit 1